jgi:ferredoxin-type protein NapH
MCAPRPRRYYVPMKTRQKTRRAAMIATAALFPVTFYYMSPLISLQGIASGIVTGSLLLFGTLFLSALFVGRAFCGWVCPGAGVQEVVLGFRGRAVKRTRINWVKWIIWGPWVAALVFFALRAGGVTAVDPTFQTWHGISTSDMPSLIALASVLLVFFALALAVGRRAVCHTICWIAPFMIMGRAVRNVFSWPSLRLAASAEACTSCGSCVKKCPMSIGVTELVQKEKMENVDCILCGSCVDACPSGSIRFTFSSGQ